MENNRARQIIDVWGQPVLARARKFLPEVVRLFEQSGTGRLLDLELTPQEIVALMDKAGIDKIMLCAWCRPGCWIVTNDEVAKYVTEFPQRFVGVAAVDLSNPVAAVNELDRVVRHLGFKALRVIPWLWKLPPNDKLYYPLYVKCIELDIPFCTQVGQTGPLMPSEPGRPIPYLDEVALTFRDLRIVGGHIGYPWADEMISLAWKHDNVFIDTSAYTPRHYPPQLVQFLRTSGQNKVLFATNFPQLSLKKCTQQIHELSLPSALEDKFLFKNACRVFGLTA